tara:strand:- start:1263 stop:2174 length:912 start_codon:yes stop_codon:yes gene_type:complete
MLLNQSQQEKFKKYQLILLTNLSLICWVFLIMMPDLFHLGIQLILLLTTVTIIGIPHGYFDFLIAKNLYSKYKHWLQKFIFIYLSISVAYLFVWLMSPVLALIAFLMMAIYHFGQEETEDIIDNSKLLLISLGSVPVVAPILFQSIEVFSLFNILLNQNISHPQFSLEIKYLYIILLALIIFIKSKKLIPLYLLLMINFIYLPPLISFILYFCFHHSLRHYLQSLSDSNLFPQQISIKNITIFFLALTLLFTAGSIYLLSVYSSFSIEEIVIKYIFISLACLTLPHLLLNIIYEHKLSSKVPN